MSGCFQAKQSQAVTKEVVASLRECVLGHRQPAGGPIIICCVHSANHSTHFLWCTRWQTLVHVHKHSWCVTSVRVKSVERLAGLRVWSEKREVLREFPDASNTSSHRRLSCSLESSRDSPDSTQDTGSFYLLLGLAAVTEVISRKTLWYTGSDFF